MKKIAILSLALVQSLLVLGQIEFTGYLTDQNNKKLKQVTIKLYDENEIISSNLVNNKFNYTLSANKHYTLEIEKDGFFVKRIAISTVDAQNTSEPFSFIVEMIEKNDTTDDSASDFPSAIIEYKKSKKAFDFNTTYAKSVKKEQAGVLEEN